MPCFPAKPAKSVLEEVKALADALGERRDADVAIATLDSFAAAMPHPDRRGIESLADEFRDEQLAANADLAAPVEAARIDALQRSVHDLATAARLAAGTGPERDAELDGGDA
jgi:CHAD domain-containing protein